jgi:hypothetical protein
LADRLIEKSQQGYCLAAATAQRRARLAGSMARRSRCLEVAIRTKVKEMAAASSIADGRVHSPRSMNDGDLENQ